METELYKFSKKEVLSITSAFFILCFCMYILISDLTFRQYFLDIDVLKNREHIGTLIQQQGSVKRSKSGELYFQSILKTEPLYSFDSIVTDSRSGATVELKDGSTIKLNSNTMIRLELKPQFTLTGLLSKAPEITVMSGEISGEAKGDIKVKTPEKEIVLEKNKKIERIYVEEKKQPNHLLLKTQNLMQLPTLSFSKEIILKNEVALPVLIEHQSPRNLEELSFNLNEVVQGKEFLFNFLSNTKDLKGVFELYLEGELIKKLNVLDFSYEIPVLLERPGRYKWIISYAELGESKKKEGLFSVSKNIIYNTELLDFRVSQLKTESNRHIFPIKDKLNFFFRFQSVLSAQRYELKLYSQSNQTQIFKAANKAPVFLAEAAQLRALPQYYRLKVVLKNGFIIEDSNFEKIRFEFSPPLLVLPNNGSQVLGQQVLFTWARTNFTENYYFELSYQDPSFRKIYFAEKIQDNSIILKQLPKGEYFWRVSSRSQNIISAYSQLGRFFVK